MSFWVTEYRCKNDHVWLEQGGVVGTMHLGRSREQGYGECPECLQEGKLTGNPNPLGIDNSKVKFYFKKSDELDITVNNQASETTIISYETATAKTDTDTLSENELRVLVTGDRNWADRDAVSSALHNIVSLVKTTSFFGNNRQIDKVIIINGACRGADRLSTEVSNVLIKEQSKPELLIEVEEHPADWEKFGKRAGPVRNTEMAKRNPHVVVAFHNDIKSSKGTKNMLKQVVDNVPLIVLVSDKETLFFLRDDNQSGLMSKTRSMTELKALLES